MQRTWIVSEDDSGDRVDVVLAALADITRSQARRWIEAERVTLNATAARASQRVQTGDELAAEPPEAIASPLTPEAIELAVLHEDADLIVIDKPAGLVVHPAPGHASGTLVNALLHHCGDLAGVGGVLRPGIVHRLDRGTSGVMLAAKNDAAHAHLSAQFREHSIEREYRALVRGVPSQDEGRVDRSIGRHRTERKRMSVRSSVGREAHTAWHVLRRYAKAERSWLSILPETGRTHQIRVHLASIGLPIVSDPLYGGRGGKKGATLERPALHAMRLGFEHPRSRERMAFEAALPDDISQLLALLEAGEG